MAIAVLKMLTDTTWYLAFMAPILAALPDVAEWALLMVPVLWILYLALFWKKRDFISDIQDMVLFEARFLLVVGVVELCFIGPSRWQTLCSRPVLLFLIFGIFLLRAGRIAEAPGEKRGFWSTSGISLLAALSAAAVLSSKTVRDSVLWLLQTIYNHLITPLLEAFFWLFAGFCSILVTLFSMLFSISISTENQEIMELDLENPLELEEASTVQTPLPVKFIGYLLLILAAAAILFYLYRRLAGNAGGWKLRAAGSITRSPDGENPDSSERPGLFGRRRNVRYYYRKFLRLCVEKGLDAERPLTSSAVHNYAILYWDEEKSGEFRDLYRRARYGGEPEDDDVKRQAKELYQSFLSAGTK
ncbi:MAG: hypothetical protein LUF35_12125 [Lachnospiraceae bacterium]|nr:hypothetical protein [Lachnospiraceae bacterium]